MALALRMRGERAGIDAGSAIQGSGAGPRPLPILHQPRPTSVWAWRAVASAALRSISSVLSSIRSCSLARFAYGQEATGVNS